MRNLNKIVFLNTLSHKEADDFLNYPRYQGSVKSDSSNIRHVGHCLNDGHVGKQQLALKEYCEEYWSKRTPRKHGQVHWPPR